VRFSPAAIAAALVLAALFLPVLAPGLARSLEADVATMLHWTPPPPAPRKVWSAMAPQPATLAQAQARVDFTIVPPDGLPSGASLERISTTAPGVYSKRSRSWSVGNASVAFIYRRESGGEFILWASRADPREGPPSKYMFEDMDRRSNGHEVVIRRDRYTWRNGTQTMTAITGDALNGQEIVAIRGAMRGEPVREVWPPQYGSIDKEIRLP
jgi:hypothetical protein